MNKPSLVNVVTKFFFALVILVGSTVSAAREIKSKEYVQKTTLVSRYTGGTFSTASFSFRHSSHDLELTKNNMEIIFEGREDSQDFFAVNLAVDDNSVIYDLGETSCKKVKASAAAKAIPATSVLVKQGHCYLTINKDNSGRIKTLFRVAKHTKSVSVKIDEIKVLENYSM